MAATRASANHTERSKHRKHAVSWDKKRGRGQAMRKPIRILLIALLAVVGSAQAQIGGSGANLGPVRPPQYGPFYRPALSPYLNLLRGGDPAANFFLGTVPEFQRRSDTFGQQRLLGELEERTRPDSPLFSGTVPIPNSTRRYFNNTGGYYPPVQLPRR